jgi:hypothetical protein
MKSRLSSSNVQDAISVGQPAPFRFEPDQALDSRSHIVNAARLESKRIFTEAILAWWDTHADRVCAELTRKAGLTSTAERRP